MSNFAIIETGGKQYRVATGDKIKVEKLNSKGTKPLSEGDSFVFDKVLLRTSGNTVEVGTPYVKGAKVEGKILRQNRDKKKIVFKYHSKTRYKKKKGHRQWYAELEIKAI